MSKLDAQRAMREARYAQRVAPAAPAAATTDAPTRAVKPARKQAAAQRLPANTVSPDALACGHRAISGRTCTREQGHPEKSHRYS
jgi:hypothetical protein